MKLGKLLRRAGALFFATIAVWWLSLLGGWGISSSPSSSPRGAYAAAAGDDTLNGWVRLVVGQSPYLRAGHVLQGAGAPPSNSESPTPVPAPSSDPDPGFPLSDEDDTQLPSVTTPPENIVAQTFLPTGSSAYTSAGGVFVYNRTQYAVDMEALSSMPVTLTGKGKGPHILIIHSHATESYTQYGQDAYQESDPFRTTDDAHNVVRVGDEMAAAFAQAGLNVLHDRTLHDYPNYNESYARSYSTVEEYLAAYPSISVVLDVHRDALMGADDQVYKAVADPDTLPGTAQVMLVVGTNESGADHPNWKQNLAFAITLERALNAQAPTLARPITLRRPSYNQQLSPGSLLVEVGTHGNSLQEAIAAARAFAEVTAPVIRNALPQT